MNPGPLIILHCIHPIFNRNEAFVFLHGHALLLILTKSSKSKNQVVHEQKFKDPLSSTCQVSSERRVLDLELEVMD